MKEGDRNTKFFHTCAKVKIAKASISHLVDGDNVYMQPSDIESYILNYYKSLYSSVQTASTMLLLDSIPQVVSAEHNAMLTQIPTTIEIRTAVFGLILLVLLVQTDLMVISFIIVGA